TRLDVAAKQSAVVARVPIAGGVGEIQPAVGTEAEIVRRDRIAGDPIERAVAFDDLNAADPGHAFFRVPGLRHVNLSVERLGQSVRFVSDLREHAGGTVLDAVQAAVIHRYDDDLAIGPNDGSLGAADTGCNRTRC